MVVWAEIPYISKHMAKERNNTISQMKELIVQNYNHPSIVVWGLSNEITMNSSRHDDMLENHIILNNLVHEMDATRKTALAVLSSCSVDDPYLRIPDTITYNHYFGWYGGEIDEYGKWFDEFHKKYPDQPIGCSEYGCEALNWHTSSPEPGDYTEEYQAYYHEKLIRQLFSGGKQLYGSPGNKTPPGENWPAGKRKTGTHKVKSGVGVKSNLEINKELK